MLRTLDLLISTQTDIVFIAGVLSRRNSAVGVTQRRTGIGYYREKQCNLCELLSIEDPHAIPSFDGRPATCVHRHPESWSKT